MADKIKITQEGWDKLNEEYRHLIDVERPEIIEAIANARAMGDLSENADYQTAKDRESQIATRISELEAILDNSIVQTKSAKSSKIDIGNKVTYKNLSKGTDNTIEIVASVNANPKEHKISNESPIGVALLKHKVGDTVTVMTEKPYDIIIKEVK